MLMDEPESTSAIIGIPFASILWYKLPWQSLFKIISCSNDPLTRSATESRVPDAAEFTELGTRHSRSQRRACTSSRCTSGRCTSSRSQRRAYTSSFQVRPRIVVDEVVPRLQTFPYPMSECSAVETGPSVFFRTGTSPVSGFLTDSAQTRPLRSWFCYCWPKSGIYILDALVLVWCGFLFQRGPGQFIGMGGSSAQTGNVVQVTVWGVFSFQRGPGQFMGIGGSSAWTGIVVLLPIWWGFSFQMGPRQFLGIGGSSGRTGIVVLVPVWWGFSFQRGPGHFMGMGGSSVRTGIVVLIPIWWGLSFQMGPRQFLGMGGSSAKTGMIVLAPIWWGFSFPMGPRQFLGMGGSSAKTGMVVLAPIWRGFSFPMGPRQFLGMGGSSVQTGGIGVIPVWRGFSFHIGRQRVLRGFPAQTGGIGLILVWQGFSFQIGCWRALRSFPAQTGGIGLIPVWRGFSLLCLMVRLSTGPVPITVDLIYLGTGMEAVELMTIGRSLGSFGHPGFSSFHPQTIHHSCLAYFLWFLQNIGEPALSYRSWHPGAPDHLPHNWAL